MERTAPVGATPRYHAPVNPDTCPGCRIDLVCRERHPVIAARRSTS